MAKKGAKRGLPAGSWQGGEARRRLPAGKGGGRRKLKGCKGVGMKGGMGTWAGKQAAKDSA